MYVYTHAYMHVGMYACMYACMHTCMYACMYVCLYVCLYVCMYVCAATFRRGNVASTVDSKKRNLQKMILMLDQNCNCRIVGTNRNLYKISPSLDGERTVLQKRSVHHHARPQSQGESEKTNLWTHCLYKGCSTHCQAPLARRDIERLKGYAYYNQSKRIQVETTNIYNWCFWAMSPGETSKVHSRCHLPHTEGIHRRCQACFPQQNQRYSFFHHESSVFEHR